MKPKLKLFLTIFLLSGLTANSQPVDLNDYKNKLYDDLDMVWFLSGGAYQRPQLKNKVKPGVNFINNFGIDAETVVTFMKFGRSELINGPFYMNFYKQDKDARPCAVFSGTMKNGLPDGFCIFTNSDERKNINGRAGLWENGKFIFEAEGVEAVKKYEQNINYSDFGFDPKEIRNKKLSVPFLAFSGDPFNERLSNGLDATLRINFTYLGNYRFLDVNVRRNDFYGPDVITRGRNDLDYFIDYENRNANTYNQPGVEMLGGVFNNIVRQMVDGPDDVYFSDNLIKISRSRQNFLTTEPCYYRYIDGVKQAVGNQTSVDESCTVTTSYGTNPSSEAFKPIFKVELYHHGDCDGSDLYHFQSIYGGDKKFDNIDDALAAIAKEALESVPATDKITMNNIIAEDENKAVKVNKEKIEAEKKRIFTAQQKENLLDSLDKMKAEFLLQRIKSTPDFRDTLHNDPIAGIWYEAAQQMICYKYPQDNHLSILSLKKIDINTSFLSAIETHNFVFYQKAGVCYVDGVSKLKMLILTEDTMTFENTTNNAVWKLTRINKYK